MVICRGLVMSPMGPAVEVDVVQGVGWKEIPDGLRLHLTHETALALARSMFDYAQSMEEGATLKTVRKRRK